MVLHSPVPRCSCVRGRWCITVVIILGSVHGLGPQFILSLYFFFLVKVLFFILKYGMFVKLQLRPKNLK